MWSFRSLIGLRDLSVSVYGCRKHGFRVVCWSNVDILAFFKLDLFIYESTFLLLWLFVASRVVLYFCIMSCDAD